MSARTFCADDSAIPDVELYRALLPALMTLRGPLIAISSPHMRRGLMYELYGKYFGKDVRGLYIQAPSMVLNPSLDADMIDRAMAADPEAARSEYGAEFRGDLSAYLPIEDIDAAVVPMRRSLPPSYQYRHVAFCDPSAVVATR